MRTLTVELTEEEILLLQWFVDHTKNWTKEQDKILLGLEKKFKDFWVCSEWNGYGN
jgi:hypothetical protein